MSSETAETTRMSSARADVRAVAAGPGLFATWLLMLLVALRIQRALLLPPIPISYEAGRALTFVFLIGWIFGVCWAMLALPSTSPRRSLVTSGPFRFVRHPLYAVSLFFLGLVTIVSSRSWIVAAVWPLAYVQAHLWAALEERPLAAAFGDAWRAYAARTPRFFPFRLAASGRAD